MVRSWVLSAIRSDEKAREGDLEATCEVAFHSTRHILSTTLTTIAGYSTLTQLLRSRDKLRNQLAMTPIDVLAI